jgi:hypothetical protein
MVVASFINNSLVNPGVERTSLRHCSIELRLESDEMTVQEANGLREETIKHQTKETASRWFL